MSLKYPSDDNELEQIVRGETGYDDADGELSTGDMEIVIEQSKGRMELETGSDAYYSDDGLGYALAAYTKMRAKAAVENVPLSSYNIGDEQVSFDTDDPEDSHQLQQWAEDVRVGLDGSELDESHGPTMKNTSGYIGESYVHEEHGYDSTRY